MEKIEQLFPGSNVSINDDEVKVTTKELNHSQIKRLGQLDQWFQVSDVLVKRSGAGLTVIVKGNFSKE